MVKLGREEPVASMDASGKIIWARHNEVQTVNVKSLGDAEEVSKRGVWGGWTCAQGGVTSWLLLAGLYACLAPVAARSLAAHAHPYACNPPPALAPQQHSLQTDGERLPLAVKDLGSSDIYPQSLQHSPNGRFVTVRREQGQGRGLAGIEVSRAGRGSAGGGGAAQRRGRDSERVFVSSSRSAYLHCPNTQAAFWFPLRRCVSMPSR